MREPFGLSHFYFLLPPQHHDAAHIYTHLSKDTCDLKQNGTKKDSSVGINGSTDIAKSRILQERGKTIDQF